MDQGYPANLLFEAQSSLTKISMVSRIILDKITIRFNYLA